MTREVGGKFIDLPGMYSDELADQLKANPATQDIPILILSVFSDDPASVQFGAYALQKPIELQQHLAAAIAGKDGVIVSGWFGRAIPLAGESDRGPELAAAPVGDD